MLAELEGKDKVVGVKQLKKALRNETAVKVFVAQDADPGLLEPVLLSCREHQIPVEEVETMMELGKACGIQVGAAVAALIKP